MSNSKVSELRSGGHQINEEKQEFIIPDFIEIECTKTKMYKLIAEGFCYKSPEYNLGWKVSPCKVDLTIKNSLLQSQNSKLEKQIKHDAMLHTLRFIPTGAEKANRLAQLISNTYIPIPDESFNEGSYDGGYNPPEIYDITGGSESVKNSIDIDSVNNMDEFRRYIQANMV